MDSIINYVQFQSAIPVDFITFDSFPHKFIYIVYIQLVSAPPYCDCGLGWIRWNCRPSAFDMFFFFLQIILSWFSITGKLNIDFGSIIVIIISFSFPNTIQYPWYKFPFWPVYPFSIFLFSFFFNFHTYRSQFVVPFLFSTSWNMPAIVSEP